MMDVSAFSVLLACSECSECIGKFDTSDVIRVMVWSIDEALENGSFLNRGSNKVVTAVT